MAISVAATDTADEDHNIFNMQFDPVPVCQMIF